MILSSKSMLEAYRSDIGLMGGDSTKRAEPTFDRVLMIAIITVSLTGASEETSLEVVKIFENDRNMVLVEMLLSALERILGGKDRSNENEEPK